MKMLLQERQFRKYMLQSDSDNDGKLSFTEFKVAVTYARKMLKRRH